MKSKLCSIIQDVLPLYEEQLVSEETHQFIQEHLKDCSDCEEAYKKAKTTIKIKPKVSPVDKSLLHYLLGIRLWYLFCPLIAILFMILGWNFALKLYEFILILFSLSCIGSDLYHQNTWWDPECMQLQAEIRHKAKTKRNKFYVRPILIGLPSILVVVLLKLPQIISYILMLI